ncbi:DUF397 domain-containing protein [Streptomyces sp. NPDC088190]|jgi:hypothetical protein|uniref:DUF397 domain-containing protein n=1 Tax=unclassified Streptomyces TaxID=2593676 RepID=UPI00081AFEA2|nr:MULTISPECIES: DUF397 domain-containing protein [unclassified Streptomyces]MEE1844817.1 DUF397 domain-containing protein [Streptomyces sp. JV190]MYQ85934.1 DUF397 domain-containing protein [Streptomyces sp. SID4936]SCE14231.1 protein of unknown function [Streptomyces sp. DvalAA-43]
MSADIEWQKSSFSGGGEQCVEVARQDEEILVRESDDPRAVTRTSRSKFAAFIQGVKAGEFDHFAQ